MAKGQKRGNREAKKPQQVKTATEAAPVTSLTKGIVSTPGSAKNKKK